MFELKKVDNWVGFLLKIAASLPIFGFAGAYVYNFAYFFELGIRMGDVIEITDLVKSSALIVAPIGVLCMVLIPIDFLLDKKRNNQGDDADVRRDTFSFPFLILGIVMFLLFLTIYLYTKDSASLYLFLGSILLMASTASDRLFFTKGNHALVSLNLFSAFFLILLAFATWGASAARSDIGKQTISVSYVNETKQLVNYSFVRNLSAGILLIDEMGQLIFYRPDDKISITYH